MQFSQQIRVVSVHLKNRTGVGVSYVFLIVDECNFPQEYTRMLFDGLFVSRVLACST
jgi:hypothetical protein